MLQIIFMTMRRTEKSLVISYQFIYSFLSVLLLFDILGLSLLILDFIFVVGFAETERISN